MNFDDILIKLGEFGRYQKLLYFLAVCLPGISCGVYMVISVFLLGVPDHRCALPFIENDTYAIQSETHRSLIDLYIPNTDPDDDTLLYDRCSYYVYDNTSFISPNGSRHKESCSEWVYSEDVFKSTFAKEINLVCDDRYKTSLAKSLFFLGVLLGALGLGILSDAIGRKKTLCLSVIAMMASTIGLAWAPNYIAFVLIRICVGAATSGVFMTGFVIGMELVGPGKRLFAGVVNEIFFAVGLVLLAGVAYALRDWFWIELSLSIPTVVFISFWCILPESPRWLLSKGRIDEAEEVLRKAAKVNNVTLPEKLFDDDVMKKPETAALWNLFTSRVLLFRTLIIFFNWMVVSMTYYGLSLNTGNLGGDFYVNFLISGVVEFPAYGLCLILLDRWGRKKCHCTSMLLGGIACLCTIFTISFGGKEFQWLTTTLAMIGKLGSAAAFAVIYVFSAELYPTVVRNAGMGASSCCARIGGILAPYVADSGVLIGGQFGQAVPLVIFGGASVLAGLLSLKLPETLDESLPETIDDGIAFGTPEYRKKSLLSLAVEAPSPDIGMTKL
ncbi:organic cation transporter protein-like [Saccostrea echinata]|uniref:organic cation transporter protein-like n=1 Tax=Saccostrea echinata TaxID=191078 RepID=UPI002A81F8A5|nr:organic cation transporter protein-like [Saccostrea echinata]